MKLDPTLVQLTAENVHAEVLPVNPALKIDPQMVQKIRQRVPIFGGMSAEVLMQTLALAQTVTVAADVVVCQEGERGQAFFVLLSGEVRIEKLVKNRVVELARLGPGHSFGEMALVGKSERSATVRALSECNAMRFEREQIDAHPGVAHIVYRNVAAILASRLKSSSDRLADLSSLQPEE